MSFTLICELTNVVKGYENIDQEMTYLQKNLNR